MSIALVDYGAGNLASVRKGFAAADADLFTPASPAELAGTSGIVVPGVGNFGATAALDGAWRDSIARHVAEGVPLLGICLGMQWLFEGSEESPGLRGLGVLPGLCVRIRPGNGTGELPIKVPHVGWNVLAVTHPSQLMSGVGPGTYVYFTHSYAAPAGAHTAAVTRHGGDLPAVVEKDNVFGVQFHPEKSGPAGVRMLRTFVEICRAR